MIPFIFISGPYSASDYYGINDNINQARKTAAYIARLGAHFVCPHLNSAHFEVITPEIPAQYWYDLDLHLLSKCSAAVFIKGWTKSTGASNEHAQAKSWALPVFDLTQKSEKAKFEAYVRDVLSLNKDRGGQ